MFQPNVAPWQQQQHHQQPTQSQQQQQLQHQQQSQPQFQQQNNTSVPHAEGKWNQHGLSAPAEQQTPFQSFNYNPVANQTFLNNHVNYEHQQGQSQQQINNAVNLQPQLNHQSLTQNFFDNNQNNTGKNEEWGDWGDWNENNINMENNNQQKTFFHSQPTQPDPTQNATNIINESFSASDNNWNWNVNINSDQTVNNVLSTTTPNLTNSTVLPSPPAMQAQQQQVQRNFSDFQQPPAQILDRAIESVPQIISQESNTEHLNHLVKSTLPQTTASTNNIPNTVFVTQAKPVTMPSRQYASNPSEISAPTSVEQIIAPPPERFQNDVPKITSSILQQPMTGPVAAIPIGVPPNKTNPVVSLPPPASVVAPLPSITPVPPSSSSGLPPPISSGVSKSNGNPFKRTGGTQHHVANFIPTTQPVVEQTSFLPMKINDSNNSFFEPPPAPLVYEQPDNSEILHENQEVVTQSYAHQQPQHQQQQHLNDERNQYLQTSHLSENAIEENVEGDSLPPPGLSRLVLGEPELEANQRLVTGTEDTLPDLVGNMRLDERQADGEDNTNDVSAVRNAITVGSVQASTAGSTVDNMQIVADRNLYLVPGQSNGNNDQLPRVLTGLDNAVQIDTPTPTHSIQHQQNHTAQHQKHINIAEQREIELDGENIEDQQQPQMPQQRNEPPVEGAAAQVKQQQQIANSAIDIKETAQTIMSKDESDLDQQRKHLSNSRKQLSKEHNQHQHVPEMKHGSIDRFNSDEETDEAEYSSDRERERERNRHRRAYREGSVRSELGREHERERNRDKAWEREREENELYQKERRRRDRKEREGGEKERPREKYRVAESGPERRSKRYTRYEHDSSVEETSRKEKSLREKKSLRDHRERDKDRRSDREYDEYNRRYRHSKRGMERDEDGRPRRDRDRDYDEAERRRRRDKLGNNRQVDAEREEYEEYRKHSSRNARESDIEKERGPRSYDPRHAAMYGYHHGGQVTGTYDPYYYYDYMARYNHPAYNEMIKKYYGAQSIVSTGDISGVGGTSSTAATGPGSDHLTGDGRESVHSGRSSLQQEHER